MPFATLRKRLSEKPLPSGSGGVTTPRQQGIEDSESQRARALLTFDRAVCLLMLTAAVVLLLQQPQRITQVLLLATIGVIFARTWWTITHRD